MSAHILNPILRRKKSNGLKVQCYESALSGQAPVFSPRWSSSSGRKIACRVCVNYRALNVVTIKDHFLVDALFASVRVTYK